MTPAKDSTRRFKPRPCRNGIAPSRFAGMRPVRSCMAHWAAASPRALPASERTHALGHELGDEPRGRRAHRPADGDLPPAALGTDEQQAHDVHARDDEQQPGSPQQHQQGRPDGSHDHFRQGKHGRALAAVGIGVLGFQPLRNGFHVRQGGLHRDAVLEPAHAVEPMAAPPEIAVALRVKRRPELGRLGGGKVELPRQHSDDDGGIAAEDDRLAQDVRAAPVPRLPRTVAEQDGAGRLEQVLAVMEVASEHRRDAEGAEEAIAHPGPGRGLGARLGAQPEARLAEHLERAQDLVELLPVEVVGIGKVALRKQRDGLEDAHQPGGIPIGQRLQQRRIHEGEDGHARARFPGPG